MGRLSNTLTGIFFWWTMFLLLLVFGFNISLHDLINNILNGNIHYSIISVLLLVSPIIYIILSVVKFIQDRQDDLFLSESFGMMLMPYFWKIYKGFDFRDFEFPTSILNLLDNLIWWGLLAYGIWAIILTNTNNIIITKIREFSNEQVLVRLGIFLLICLVLYGIGRLLFHISGKKLREYFEEVGIL